MSNPGAVFNDRCNQSRPKFAKYCSEPCPEDPFILSRWVMSGVHLLILEIVQNIYNKVDAIPPAQQEDFTMFCLFGTQIIENHHNMEESFMFPMMQPELKTDVIGEHATFSEVMERFHHYLQSVLGAKHGPRCGQVTRIADAVKEPFSAEKIKGFLDQLVDPLFTHLEHEIEWLDPEKLRASGLKAETLKAIDDRASETAQNEQGPSGLFFFMGHKPAYCQFPPLPWFVGKILVPYVFRWKDRRLWKFLPQSFTPV